MAGFPSFEDFYAAANGGRAPFPWQARLARQVAETGRWPELIGVPTGLGKTATIDIALWALARDAALEGARRRAATRIWYVVNRRLLVDSAWLHADKLAKLLGDPASAGDPHSERTLAAVAGALSAMATLGVETGPLHVVRLRGGAELSPRPPDLTQPTLFLSTVAMFGSRLLFRGYGSSTRMRPVDAALAGIDSLVLVDEAHLAVPLLKLCHVARECDLGDGSMLLPGERARPRVVPLTATASREGKRFGLDRDDREHPVIRARLAAVKPTRLLETSQRALPDAIAQELVTLQQSRRGSAAVAFCNTVPVARAVKDAVDSAVPEGVRTFLLTGRMREREADGIRHAVLNPEHGAPADRAPDATPDLIAVATQTLEVGADLDFDFLITEACGARALVQRLGRLNRLGRRPHARATILHAPDRKAGPPYGEEVQAVWERLQRAGQPLELAPEGVAAVLGEPGDDPGWWGELLPDHLWEFAKTSAPEPDEPDPALFFDRIDEPNARVSVCWRAYLPEVGTRLLPAVREEEAVEVPIWELLDVLPQPVRRLAPDRTSLLPPCPVAALRPGDVIVLPTAAGHYDRSGWNRRASEAVLDVALLEAGVLWIDLGAMAAFLGAPPSADVADAVRALDPQAQEEDAEPLGDERERVRALVAALRASEPHPWLSAEEWDLYLDRLDSGRLVLDPTGALPPLLTAPRRGRLAPVQVREDALDELSFMSDPALLGEHLDAVESVAAKLSVGVGLPAPISEVVARAGKLHDLGKADPRFQRWLDPDAPVMQRWDRMGAKSRTSTLEIRRNRMLAGWPEGGRHEALSARLVAALVAAESLEPWQADLLLHLVISHHGHGRPLVQPVADEQPSVVTLERDGHRLSLPGDLCEVDWDQPARFRRLSARFGCWGLALLETILCEADHAVSALVVEAV